MKNIVTLCHGDGRELSQKILRCESCENEEVMESTYPVRRIIGPMEGDMLP